MKLKSFGYSKKRLECILSFFGIIDMAYNKAGMSLEKVYGGGE